MKLRVHHAPHIPLHVIKIDELFMPTLLVLYIGHSPTDGQVPSNQKPHLLRTEESDNAPKLLTTSLKDFEFGNTRSFSTAKLGRFCLCFREAKH